jgi:hypothetical protein
VLGVFRALAAAASNKHFSYEGHENGNNLTRNRIPGPTSRIQFVLAAGTIYYFDDEVNEFFSIT